jgi:hypothetical protein
MLQHYLTHLCTHKYIQLFITPQVAVYHESCILVGFVHYWGGSERCDRARTRSILVQSMCDRGAPAVIDQPWGRCGANRALQKQLAVKYTCKMYVLLFELAVAPWRPSHALHYRSSDHCIYIMSSFQRLQPAVTAEATMV